MWTTAHNVDDALDQIGMRTDGAVLSASRSSVIGRDGLALSMRLPKTITIAADGAAEEIRTTAPTVADAIEEAGITLDADDTIEPSLGTPLTADLEIAVTRVTTENATETIPLPYATETRQDPDEYEDYEDVIAAGTPGARVRDLRIVKRDGVEAYRLYHG